MLPISAEQATRLKAETLLSLTAGSSLAVWLADIDSILKILLTTVGIISGLYAALYYRALYKRLKERQ